MPVDELPRETLLELLRNFAKNWLAHDGIWFQAVEEAYGLERAMELDETAWGRFAPIEAGRIKKLLGMEDRPGLGGLEKALGYRLYAVLCRQTTHIDGGKLLFTMNECRVQETRRRKGLPEFPCKKVGLAEFSSFAKRIDDRIRTRCISCPPDERPADGYCSWEFRIEE